MVVAIVISKLLSLSLMLFEYPRCFRLCRVYQSFQSDARNAFRDLGVEPALRLGYVIRVPRGVRTREDLLDLFLFLKYSSPSQYSRIERTR